MHLFESNIETNRIATRESDKLLLKTKSNTEKRNIMYQIIKSWNSIDYNIKIQKSIPIIKRKLKKEWNKGENCTKSHCYNCNIQLDLPFKKWAIPEMSNCAISWNCKSTRDANGTLHGYYQKMECMTIN